MTDVATEWLEALVAKVMKPDTSASLMDRSHCNYHETYNGDCVFCKTLYYMQLIDESYTPNYMVAYLLGRLVASEAMIESLKVQLEQR